MVNKNGIKVVSGFAPNKDKGQEGYELNRPYVCKFHAHPENPIHGLEKLNALELQLSLKK